MQNVKVIGRERREDRYEGFWCFFVFLVGGREGDGLPVQLLLRIRTEFLDVF